MKEIVLANELKIKWPTTMLECVNFSIGMNIDSHGKEISGCIGAIDGYLLTIKCPTVKEVNNVKAFYSGHYQEYGINCQCVFDHLCRFIYIDLSYPGSTYDSIAFERCSIYDLHINLPEGFFSG